MNRKESIQLLQLLEQFYPNRFSKMDKPALKRFAAAWELALGPYAYEEVKAAAVEYARHNKFFPDLCDLTGGLVKIDSEDTEAAPARETESDRIRKMAQQLEG